MISITCKAPHARSSRGGWAAALSKWPCGDELRLVRVRGVSRRRLRAALELSQRRNPEVAADNRKLRFLRRLELALLLSDAFRHDERVRRRPDARASEAPVANSRAGGEHRHRPRHPGFLQILRFLPVERRRRT